MAREGPEATRCTGAPTPHLVASGIAPLHATWAQLARLDTVLAKIDPDAIMRSPDAQARGVREDSNGTITVEIPNVGRVEWRAAVKANLIGPKFGKPASQPTAAPTKTYPAAHPSDIATLRRNPSHGNRVNFDSHYGIGAAARYLGN